MEVWDGYKKDGDRAGVDLLREEPIPAGLYHIVSEVLVKHTDGAYLLMQRDFNKAGFPGFYEAGASGSILKGETPYQGAMRELQEETGLVADDLTLVYAQSDLKNTIYYGFFCVVSSPKNSIVLQENETISYQWLERSEFLRFINNATNFPHTQKERWLPFLGKI